ncbi:50S ribosomal protein L32 [Candidatus Amesbacteria bacterium RIFCSPHIGHO2_01_FULL_48_32]|uniref:Large ribosomal subunit protein bL32 n=1 Tax=Candidatus Amesbacteria bacterium RIFCSPLOWO2_01_FULL_48_25 TaxID=1797259 RepID=A0A1F4ZEA0_9BACT|nr:MAG: 50S ribosomal protein L32 [Candidatus Amesbacteria bacterium RIFCSPHIGHO2_01_FULL_48_32]OGD03774.1 MAG: 50S ribosomal protein L32 [Candidatus Amesbacteria bacterium RIFCSPLOWO2_01_FULL_48_25]HJZ05120.1 50S ribosomal protein L32 [Patescibacteria group bacterium]
MTPLPKRRWSTHRQGKRRATHKISIPALVPCSNCHQPTRPHRVCSHCGYYHGRDMRS